MPKYIMCGNLIDSTGKEPMENKILVIEGDRIAALLDGPEVPQSDGEVIDLSGYTVMPGLIDCHEHLMLDLGDEAAQSAQPIPYLSAIAVANAKKILQSGITTMRDVGERYFIDVEMKRAIEAGLIQGPRLLTSGHPLIRTGGHAHFFGRETDGVEDMRKAVREQLKQGVDLIKIMVSGGMSTKGSLPDSQEFSDEEIHTCVDEARRNGRKVAAHLHGGPGLKAAVEAGVHTVEHGILFTEEDVKLIAKAGTWLITTVGVGEVAESDPSTPAFYKEKATRANKNSLQVRKWAKQYGVKVAVGNDTNHCRMDTEARALIDAGWTPMEALQALTIRGAEVCGLADQVGTLEVGKFADVIAVDGNPLSDIAALRSVPFVMKAGKVEFSHCGIRQS